MDILERDSKSLAFGYKIHKPSFYMDTYHIFSTYLDTYDIWVHICRIDYIFELCLFQPIICLGGRVVSLPLTTAVRGPWHSSLSILRPTCEFNTQVLLQLHHTTIAIAQRSGANSKLPCIDGTDHRQAGISPTLHIHTANIVTLPLRSCHLLVLNKSMTTRERWQSWPSHTLWKLRSQTWGMMEGRSLRAVLIVAFHEQHQPQ